MFIYMVSGENYVEVVSYVVGPDTDKVGWHFLEFAIYMLFFVTWSIVGETPPAS